MPRDVVPGGPLLPPAPHSPLQTRHGTHSPDEQRPREVGALRDHDPHLLTAPCQVPCGHCTEIIFPNAHGLTMWEVLLSSLHR